MAKEGEISASTMPLMYSSRWRGDAYWYSISESCSVYVPVPTVANDAKLRASYCERHKRLQHRINKGAPLPRQIWPISERPCTSLM